MSRKPPGHTPDEDDQPFLLRWSRRKASLREGALKDTENQAPENQAAENQAADGQADDQGLVLEETEAELALSDDALCERYELVHPDKCETPEQLDSYFSRPLPDRLRQLAMRRLWRLNPLFRFADEMVEYGEDYTDAATIIPDMKTAYQVGKGYFDKLFVDKGEAPDPESDNGADVAQNDADDITDIHPQEDHSGDSHSQAGDSRSSAPDSSPEDQKDERIAKSGQIAQSDTQNPPLAAENSPLQQVSDSQHSQNGDIEDIILPKPQPRRMVFVKK